MVDRMTDRPAEQDTRSYTTMTVSVHGAKYEPTRIDKNRADVSLSLLYVNHAADGVLDPNSISYGSAACLSLH